MTELLDVVRRVLTWTGSDEQVEVFASRSRTTLVRAYQGEVESLTAAEPAGVGIRVIAGGRQGFASAGTLDEIILKQTLDEARDNAGFAAADEWVGLAPPDDIRPADVDLCSPALESAPTAAKVDMALELERLVTSSHPHVRSVRSVIYNDVRREQAVGSTTGIETAGRVGFCQASAEALAQNGADTQIGTGFAVARLPGSLDLVGAAAEAVERATSLLGATKPRSRRVTALLDPTVTASLLSIVGGTLSGDTVLKGRSLFAGRVGEQVAASIVTLVDDPTNPASFGAGPYDGEGLARRRNVLIDSGVLCGYLYDTHAARRAGTTSTASATRGYGSTPGIGPAALAVTPGGRTRRELVADIDEGILVVAVSGLHSGVNPVSGDFSVGATGRVIRGGLLCEPFREATIASTLQRMLLDISAVGGDLRWFPVGTGAASLIVHDVSLGGI